MILPAVCLVLVYRAVEMLTTQSFPTGNILRVCTVNLVQCNSHGCLLSILELSYSLADELQLAIGTLAAANDSLTGTGFFSELRQTGTRLHGIFWCPFY